MRHRVPRYQVIVPARYTARTRQGPRIGRGWTRDLSETGACLQISEHLSPATPLTLVIENEAGGFTLEARVVWVGSPAGPDQSRLHGVEFSRDCIAIAGGAVRAWLIRRSVAVARLAAALPAVCRRTDAQSQPLDGWTADLGYGGCGLFLPEHLPVGTLVDVVLTTPGGELKTSGVIVWETGSKGSQTRHLFEHGLRFTRTTAGKELLNTLDAAREAKNRVGMAVSVPSDQS